MKQLLDEFKTAWEKKSKMIIFLLLLMSLFVLIATTGSVIGYPVWDFWAYAGLVLVLILIEVNPKGIFK